MEPLVDNCESLEVLTLAYFLVGGPLVALPTTSAVSSTASHRQRWRLMLELLESFGRCWSSDYVQTLQFRSKWTLEKRPVTGGQMVLVHQPILPLAKWP